MGWKNDGACGRLFEGMNKAMAKFAPARKEYDRMVARQKKFRVPYAGRVFDEKEMLAALDALCEFWLTDGEHCAAFEKEFAEYVGAKYAVFVNSGSSANLLATAAIMQWANDPGEEGVYLAAGDRIVTPALCFPTTIAPAIQFGLKPVLCDVDPKENYNTTIELLNQAVEGYGVKAAIIAHTLGSPFRARQVQEWAKSKNIWLIADCCDALGAKDGAFHVSHYADMATFSFYPAHQITAGEGGMVVTDDPQIYKILRSLRDWGKDCSCPTGKDNVCGKRFEKKEGSKYSELPAGYDHKYVYSAFGFNLKATEVQAAIGRVQLQKVDSFIKAREENWNFWRDALMSIPNFAGAIEICEPPDAERYKPSWFGFVMTLKDTAGVLNRAHLVKYLEDNGIQTRPIFAGNITRQPCFWNTDLTEDDKLPQTPGADKAMNDTFWIGVYPGLTGEQRSHVVKIFTDFFTNL